MNRSTMPQPGGYTQNPQMARNISVNQTFDTVAQQLQHEREIQAMKYDFVYTVSGEVTGQQTRPFNLTIEQGTDFKCLWLTASAFSFEGDQGDDTDFPIPNSGGFLYWAGRGLSIQVTDTRSGRQLTSGFVPLELIGTPGYGMNFQNPYPLRYLFYRNTKIRFDVRNRDNSDRSHQFEIALKGFKVLTPQ